MEWVKLGDLVEITKGKKVEESKNKSEKSFRYIQIEDLRNDDNIKYTEDPKATIVNKGHVLIAWDGANAGTVGFNLEGAIGSTISALEINELYKNEFSSEFLGYYLKSKNHYLRATSTGATIPHINRIALLKLKIPKMNKVNQLAIVGTFKEIEKIINIRKEQIQAYDELIESLFFEMFGDIRINDKNFLLKKWKDVLNIVNGKNQKKVENPEGKFPIYGSGGIMSYADDWLTKENSIIIGRKGNINKPIFVKEKFWNVDTAFGLEPNTNILNANYLFGFCQVFNFERLNKAVTIPSLTKKDLLEIDIPIPPIELQNKFADYVLKIEEEKKKLNASLLELEGLFNSLMEDAFSGNLFKE